MGILQVQSGMVEYFQMDGSEPDRKAQLWIYDECLRRFGDRHTWMGFTDADECGPTRPWLHRLACLSTATGHSPWRAMQACCCP